MKFCCVFGKNGSSLFFFFAKVSSSSLSWFCILILFFNVFTAGGLLWTISMLKYFLSYRVLVFNSCLLFSVFIYLFSLHVAVLMVFYSVLWCFFWICLLV